MRQAAWWIAGAVGGGATLGMLDQNVSWLGILLLGGAVSLLCVWTKNSITGLWALLATSLFFWVYTSTVGTLHFFAALPTERQQFTGEWRVVNVPEERGTYQKVILAPLGCTDENAACATKKVLWQAPLAERFAPGERYRITCDLARPEVFDESFNYPMYLAKERVGYICKKASSAERLPVDRKERFLRILYAPRFTFERALTELYPEPAAGLAKGLLLGGDAYLSPTLTDEFRRLGLSHIVAVSGYNIVIILNALLIAGIALGLWRRSATLVAFAGTVLFIFLIGSPASAVRAGIMGLAAFGAFLFGRVSYSLRALCLAGAMMVLWNPLVLWYDAGFQLSFLATVAVIGAMRVFEEKVPEGTRGKFLLEILWLTFWVYLFLLPILVYQFGYVTLLSIFANALFLPLVPLAMLASFVGGVLILIFPPLGMFVGLVGYVPLTIILSGTTLLAASPWATLPVHVSLFWVVAWYALVGWAFTVYETRRIQKQYAQNFTCRHFH